MKRPSCIDVCVSKTTPTTPDTRSKCRRAVSGVAVGLKYEKLVAHGVFVCLNKSGKQRRRCANKDFHQKPLPLNGVSRGVCVCVRESVRICVLECVDAWCVRERTWVENEALKFKMMNAN